MRFLPLVLLALLMAVIPMVALADDGASHRGGFVLRANGDYTLDANQELNSIVVIRGNASIAGRVHDSLIIVDGDATVSGTVEGEVVVVSGSLVLESGARVKNVNLVRSDFTQNPGATVTGDISRRSLRLFSGALVLFGILFWVWSTVAVLVAGVVFAGVGGKQLRAATGYLTEAPGQSVLGAVLTVIALPLVAVLAILTVIGLPVGIGMLIFLLPALLFLGYLVTGTWLGTLMLSGTRAGKGEGHPYWQALLGLFALQVILLVPVLGGLAFAIAGPWGAGALVYHAWKGVRERPPAPPLPPPAAEQAPAQPA
jgi:hypothetical protein